MYIIYTRTSYTYIYVYIYLLRRDNCTAPESRYAIAVVVYYNIIMYNIYTCSIIIIIYVL